jgi:hypothetical protein
MKRTASAILLLMHLVAVRDGRAQKGVMLMNRIGPTSSELFVANADGSNEHPLLSASRFDYHASWSANGQWIAFTSERNGLGQADIFRVRPDGTGLEQLTDNPSLDDQPALSPDARKLAFDSTREHMDTRHCNEEAHPAHHDVGHSGRYHEAGRFPPTLVVAGWQMDRLFSRPQYSVARTWARLRVGARAGAWRLHRPP